MKYFQKKLSLVLVLVLLFTANVSISFAEESGIIAQIEVNQTMSYGLDLEDGFYTPMTQFVAEKNTAILVKLNSIVPIDTTGKTQTLTVKMGGITYATLSPSNNEGESDLIQFIPKSLQEVNEWKAGIYDFVADINGESKSLTAVFKQTKNINILAVPVKGNWGGEVKSCTGDWRTGHSFTAKVYPLANNGINWVLGNELDCSENRYDLKTSEGQYELWQALCSLQAYDDKGQPKYELIVGFVKDRQGETANLQGYTYGRPANIVTESDQDMLATVAHEVAHCYDIGDEYEGGTMNVPVNPPPIGMTGSDWNDRDKKVVGQNKYVVGDTETYGDGSIISKDQHPYEYGERGLLDNMVSFMGSGGLQSMYWTTSAIWSKLFDTFTTPVASDDTTAVDKQRYALASGLISQSDVVTFEPFSSEMFEPGALTEGTGSYAIEAQDAAGVVVGKKNFDVEYNLSAVDPTNTDQSSTLENAPFVDIIVPFPETTTKFVVKHGDTVIASQNISLHTPQINFDSIKENEALTGIKDITWSATDEDGDNLTYELLYSPNSEDWESVATNLIDPNCTVDFNYIQSGTSPMFAAIASDGFNSTVAISAIFQTPDKAPSIFIMNPEELEENNTVTFKSSDDILLEAAAYDPEEGWLDDASITWAEMDGTMIGEGAAIFVEGFSLDPDTYEVVIKATDSKGHQSERKISVVVTGRKIGDVGVSIDGSELEFDVPPTIMSGRTLVPLRKIFEALGCTVNWEATTKTITATKGNTTIILQIDNKESKLNGQTITLDVAPTILNGRTLVPVRFISESLQKKVLWDGNTKTVHISN